MVLLIVLYEWCCVLFVFCLLLVIAFCLLRGLFLLFLLCCLMWCCVLFVCFGFVELLCLCIDVIIVFVLWF